MSSFIVPTSLPSIGSIGSLRGLDEQQSTKPAGQSSIPFADILENAIQNMTETGGESQETMLGLALGGSDDLHTGSLAALKSSLAVNFASGLTSSAIRSYNELMRMQI